MCIQSSKAMAPKLPIKSHVKSPKRAFRTRLPPKVTRQVSQKVTRQVSKTSVSYETSSKSHTSSLQNERFVRDFLKNSHVKVCKTSVSYETSSKTHTSKSAKRAFRTRLPPKVKRKHPSEHTHHAALPSSFAIPTQCDSNIHLYRNSQPHDSLRLPRIFPHPHM